METNKESAEFKFMKQVVSEKEKNKDHKDSSDSDVQEGWTEMVPLWMIMESSLCLCVHMQRSCLNRCAITFILSCSYLSDIVICHYHP